MKAKHIHNIKSLFILIVVILLSRTITVFPWWGFVIPVIFTGMLLKGKKWKVSFFWMGFLAGFLVWSGANLYFDWLYPGNILSILGNLLLIPKFLVILIAGIIGGGITALAFYTGSRILAEKVVPGLGQ